MNYPIRSALTFLVGCLFFIALPGIAWGLGDIQGLLAHQARLGFFILIFVLSAFAAIRIPEIGKQRSAPKKTVPHQHLAVVLLQLFSIAIMVIGPYCDRRNIAAIGGGEALRYLGLGMYLLGFLTMHYAEAYLGRLFSVEVSIQEGHTLVTDGPYRHLRHPRYLGITVFSFGLALIFRSWLSMALAMLTTLVLLWRIRDEEALMHDEFGSEWEVYARKSWRLIPFIY